MASFKDYTKAARMVQGPILPLAMEGMKSREVVEFAISALSPFFQYPTGLHLLSESTLMTTLTRVSLLLRQPWMWDACGDCIDLYREAESAAGDACLGICRNWAPEIRRCEAMLMSSAIADSEQDESLALEDAAVRQFRHIGELTESFIQAHLREMLELVQLLEPTRAGAEVESKAFGVVVNDLIESKRLPLELLGPDPWKVRVHQWRNIAQHGSWDVVGGSVMCWYGRRPKLAEIRLTAEELTAVGEAVTNVMIVLGAARAVFLFDRATPLIELIKGEDGQIHSLHPIQNFAKMVASYGFEIAKLEVIDDEAQVVIRDKTDQDPTSRSRYVVGSVYYLCEITGKAVAQAVYQDRNGTPVLQARVHANDCKGIKSGNWHQLVPYIEFTQLQTGTVFRVPKGDVPDTSKDS